MKRGWRLNWGPRSTSKYCQSSSCANWLPGLVLLLGLRVLRAHSSAGSGPSPPRCIHSSWNSSYSTTDSTRPSSHSCQPTSFFKDSFKLTDKKASMFFKITVCSMTLKSHNFKILSSILWSPLTSNTSASIKTAASLQLPWSSAQICHLWSHHLPSHGPREEQESAAVAA